MAIAKKYHYKHKGLLRDVRTLGQKIHDGFVDTTTQPIVFALSAFAILFIDPVYYAADFLLLLNLLYFWWLRSKGHVLPSKLPMSAPYSDPNNKGPGRSGKAEGILYVGNNKDTKEEIWFTNNDARTHMLYLGTTGSGKTEGLKSLVTNALCWGSGYVYIDGKADTSLWNSLSALARRFGRDDDLLVLNYMTGNRDGGAPSNTLNPFSGGSASYLTNLLVSLMPDASGDNAMWKERAVAMIGALMPALTWRRENQEIPLNINAIRKAVNLKEIIRLTRDPDIPEKIRLGLRGYLDTLPGYVDEVFDDDGNEKPMSSDMPQVDTSTIHQQHGYLSMQFTRALQSLADDYGYIFETEAADIDMTDVVLNRRMVVVLIPALEKSSDESANLGKIVAATIKGMMGSTLGAEVEGDASTTIDNKPTASSTPFMTVFDEVGYYTSQGMAVMAAQARSLGFSLVFAAQDLPALEKRVKEEARSITANCNLKIFGKLEDPTQTKEFFEKTVGDIFVAEVSGFSSQNAGIGGGFMGKQDASIQSRSRASYDGLRGFQEGQAVVTFGSMLEETSFFYANPGKAQSMRIQKMLEQPAPDDARLRQKNAINSFLDKYRTRGWTAMESEPAIETEDELDALIEGFNVGQQSGHGLVENGAMAVACLGETFLENYPTPKPEEMKAEKSSAFPYAEAGEDEDDDGDDEGFSWSDLMADDSEDDNEMDPLAEPSAESVDDNDDDSEFSWDMISSGNEEEGDDDEASSIADFDIDEMEKLLNEGSVSEIENDGMDDVDDPDIDLFGSSEDDEDDKKGS